MRHTVSKSTGLQYVYLKDKMEHYQPVSNLSFDMSVV